MKKTNIQQIANHGTELLSIKRTINLMNDVEKFRTDRNDPFASSLKSKLSKRLSLQLAGYALTTIIGLSLLSTAKATTLKEIREQYKQAAQGMLFAQGKDPLTAHYQVHPNIETGTSIVNVQQSGEELMSLTCNQWVCHERE